MNLSRRQMLQMGAAALGIARLPAEKPIPHEAYYRALMMAYDPASFHDPHGSFITWGRWEADGNLTILKTEPLP